MTMTMNEFVRLTQGATATRTDHMWILEIERFRLPTELSRRLLSYPLPIPQENWRIITDYVYSVLPEEIYGARLDQIDVSLQNLYFESGRIEVDIQMIFRRDTVMHPAQVPAHKSLSYSERNNSAER